MTHNRPLSCPPVRFGAKFLKFLQFLPLFVAIAAFSPSWFALAQEVTAGPADAPLRPVVFSGKIAGDANATTLEFDIDSKIEVTSFYMDKPDRIVIDAPSLLFRFADARAIAPRGLVSVMQYGAITRERSRIVLSLSQPARITSLRLEQSGTGKSWRLMVELGKIGREEFAEALERQRELTGSSGAVVSKGNSVRAPERPAGTWLVVIDPGHGGIDSGATGKLGTKEKELTLALARRIKAEIDRLGAYDVMLTREDDVFLSLRERVAFAQRHKAQLVISIHADSLRQPGVRGASVYTLSKQASDELAHELQQSENMADIAGGVEAIQDEEFLDDILTDLVGRETVAFSKSFSARLVSTLGPSVELIKNPQRSASFAVLKAPEVPSVLLELGYLSNEEDERQLMDAKWQESVATLVARAVDGFFKSR